MTAGRPVAPLAALLLGAAACARPVPVDGGGASAAAAPPTARGPRIPRTENLIAEDEIRETAGVTTVFMLLERVRPQYLRPFPGLTGRLAGQLPLVYVDGRRRGPIGALRTMRPEEVVAIRRLTPAQAQARYGPDAATGIIEVTTRHPR